MVAAVLRRDDRKIAGELENAIKAIAQVARLKEFINKLIEVGEMYGFGTWDLARRIYMPAATPKYEGPP